MKHLVDHIAVLIPARDEEALLAKCLQSVLKACQVLPSRIETNIVVAVDSSTDRTFAIAQDILRGCGSAIVTDASSVGAARSLAAELALASYRGDFRHCWLANTDADCEVPQNWLTEQLLFAQAGVQAVAGLINVTDFSEHGPSVESRFHETYAIRPDGTHAHVHGANLGIRADEYLRAGGWKALTTAEDHDLWGRLGNLGCERISTSSLRVTTSGRRVGRAPLGFADTLARLNQAVA